jgi:cobalt-precorrin-5B (C1)-methyltransferase
MFHAAVFGRPPEPAATVEGLFAALGANEKRRLGNALAGAVQKAVDQRIGAKLPTAVALIDLRGRILGEAGDSKPW